MPMVTNRDVTHFSCSSYLKWQVFSDKELRFFQRLYFEVFSGKTMIINWLCGSIIIHELFNTEFILSRYRKPIFKV